MTQSLDIDKPRFSISQFLGDSQNKNQISKADEKQMIAEEGVIDVISGINNLYVKAGEPSVYYKRLLYITYLDFDVHDHIEARVKLAKELGVS